ncbi:MAG: hypothetical protein AB8G11_21435 [Saprospiraceae bacterium]
MRFSIIILLTVASWTVSAQDGKTQLYNYLSKCNTITSEIPNTFAIKYPNGSIDSDRAVIVTWSPNKSVVSKASNYTASFHKLPNIDALPTGKGIPVNSKVKKIKIVKNYDGAINKSTMGLKNNGKGFKGEIFGKIDLSPNSGSSPGTVVLSLALKPNNVYKEQPYKYSIAYQRISQNSSQAYVLIIATDNKGETIWEALETVDILGSFNILTGTVISIPKLKNGGGGIKITTAPQFKYPDDFKKPEKSSDFTDIEDGTTIFLPDGNIKQLANGKAAPITIFNGKNPVQQLKNGGGGGIKITTAPQFKYPDDFKKPDEKNGGNMAQPGMDMANMMMANMMMKNMQQQGNQSVVIFLNTTNPANPFVEIIRGDKTQKAIEMDKVLKGKTGYILTAKK